MTVTASASRAGDYTQPHMCGGCAKLFFAKSAWNRVTVKCPHCAHLN